MTNPDDLYEDLIYEILSRLPVKTLLRCKSVCKLWLSIISSPCFIKSHLSQSTNNPRLILCDWMESHVYGPHTYPFKCPLNSLLNESKAQRLNKICKEYHDIHVLGSPDECILKDVPVTVAMRRTVDDRKINGVVGYCNGLVCLTSTERVLHNLYLWNPATRKARQLPNLEPRNMELSPIYKNHYGFCYDALNDDFKVYAIYNGYGIPEYEVSVYSSKSDCWRFIGDFPFGDVADHEPVIFANGALHWMVVKDSDDGEWMVAKGPYVDPDEAHIISLDINTEIYREILQPTYIGGEDGYYYLHLGIFGKSLSLLCKFHDHADFWVLKGCGVEEAWTKLFTIPYMDGITMLDRIKPNCITVNGDILLHFDSTIVLYNPKNNTFKDVLEINFFKCYKNKCCKADVYTYFESLVSP